MFNEHRIWTDPKAGLVVERTVNHEWLKRFAMPSHAYNLVFATLVVTIKAEREFWQWR